MINYKKEIADIIAEHVSDLTAEEIEGLVEIPQDQTMGDYAFPCFKLAKVFRKAPNLIAADVAEAISGNSLFEKVEPVKAYVNMFLSKQEYAASTLKEALDADNFGKTNVGEGKRGIVE